MRTRLIIHGISTGVLFGVLTGIADAWTTRHEFLDRSFLFVAILDWLVCGIAGGLALGILAALLPVRSGKLELAGRAGAVSAVMFAGSLWFLVLVHVNVVYLATDTGREALIFDVFATLGSVVVALGAARLAAHAIRSWPRSLPVRALLTPFGMPVFAGIAWIVAALAWRGGVGAVGAPEARPHAAAPDVVLILIDTLRGDHLSGDGYESPTSPALDEFARRGARFDSFHSQSSYTKPAVASLLTGLYPSGHRVGHLRTVLSESQLTLAELFHDAGYRTANFVANTIVGPEFGFAQGAELFHTLPSELTPKTKLGYALFRLAESGHDLALIPRLTQLFQALEHRLAGRKGEEVLGLDATEITAAFWKWRESIGEDPYFAYLHVMEPHAPYEPAERHAREFESPEEPLLAEHPPTTGVFAPFSRARSLPDASTRGLIRAYDAEIAGVDEILGKFLEDLEREGRPVIVAVTSDHGEEFYEHGGWGHGHSLYEEVLRIPLLLMGPGVPPGIVVKHPAQLVDLGPTLMVLAGLEVPPQLSGRSLVPLLQGASSEADSERFSELVYGESFWSRSLRVGRWKLIVSQLGEERRQQLFDLGADPMETRDLSQVLPGRAAAMKERIEALVAGASRGAAPEAVAEFDAVTRRRLEALGYVDNP